MKTQQLTVVLQELKQTKPSCLIGGLVVVALSVFARSIAAVGTVNETELADIVLYERISAEIGDEILGPPRTLLCA